IVPGVEEGHRPVPQPQAAAADVEQPVMGLHPLVQQGGDLGAGGFVPAAADDLAVAAGGKGAVVEAGGEIGRGHVFVAAAFIRASRAVLSCAAALGAPFWAPRFGLGEVLAALAPPDLE